MILRKTVEMEKLSKNGDVKVWGEEDEGITYTKVI